MNTAAAISMPQPGEPRLQRTDIGLKFGVNADLVLLRQNPFDDLEALWDQEGVMVRGRWIPRTQIDEWLQSMAVAGLTFNSLSQNFVVVISSAHQ